MMTPQQLKNSILQRAIEGKLVDQRPEEGTAKELLKQIKAEKDRLVKEGKIKKTKPLPPITEDEIPFEIPKSWEWVRFDDFGIYKKGPFGSALTKSIFVPKGTDTIKVYEQKNAIQKDVNLGSYYITKQYYEEKMTSFSLEAGDIIVSCAGTIGETFIIPNDFEPGIINQALMRMRLMPSVYVSFFLLYFDVILKKTARKDSKGSALKNIPPFAELKLYPIPLPPLSEQQRIVAKIEELLPLVDEYDKAYSQLATLNEKFPADMKKSILQYAIEGKLVEQRPEEGTAADLLKQIKAEKAKLIKEGKIKKEKPLPPIIEEEIPFDIPESWEWDHIGEIFSHNTGKALNRLDKDGVELDYITTSNLYWDKFELDSLKKMFFKESEVEKYSIQKGDLLVCEGGEVGRAAIWNFDYSVCIQNHIHRLRAYKQVETRFFYYIFCLYKLSGKINGKGIGIKGLSAGALHKLIVPIPPLAEQRRIVEKLEQLLLQCDKLSSLLQLFCSH